MKCKLHPDFTWNPQILRWQARDSNFKLKARPAWDYIGKATSEQLDWMDKTNPQPGGRLTDLDRMHIRRRPLNYRWKPLRREDFTLPRGDSNRSKGYSFKAYTGMAAAVREVIPGFPFHRDGVPLLGITASEIQLAIDAGFGEMRSGEPYMFVPPCGCPPISPAEYASTKLVVLPDERPPPVWKPAPKDKTKIALIKRQRVSFPLLLGEQLPFYQDDDYVLCLGPCGKFWSESVMEIAHLHLPKSQAKSTEQKAWVDDLRNLGLMCSPCNGAQGARSLGKFYLYLYIAKLQTQFGIDIQQKETNPQLPMMRIMGGS